ncbi:dipeptide/oligopeptide/nickel ABC transporter permease/ATP-binding protein [Cellulomonas soli]|uniref:dipeptide/oligopeptide/nickel ABC transporter permease/ATP-binding protein n=1 Tax=Cellulomonas soli TaxID=931535 RepID=UPI003F85214E
MTTTPTTPDLTAPTPSLARRLLRDPLGALALGFLLLVVLAAVFAPLLTSHDPNEAVLADVLAPPGGDHLLGADSSGRDVWARLLYACRFSLLGAALAVLFAVVIGAVSGLIAGYFGKWFDELSSWAASILMALPAMVVLLAARSVVGPSAWWAMGIFGVLLSASVFRLVRSTVQSVRGELYVDAARVSGLSDLRIIFRHVLRVVRAPIIIQVASIAAVAIAIQAGLEVLGLGDMTIPTWGSMLNDGFAKIYQAPILLLWPSLLIAFVCLALSLVANSLRDALEGTAGAKKARPTRVAADFVPTESTSTHGAVLATDDPSVILRVQQLRIAYAGGAKEVVHGISFDVRAGEVLGLIGESGSGKTQTAFGIMRLLPEGGAVAGGRVLWKGTDLAGLGDREMTAMRGSTIAYIPQEPMSNLDPTFTIGHQLIEPMRLHLKISKKEARERAMALLRRVGIPDPARTMRSYPHEVSGGMAQRVLIAGAISCEPDLLIADEPTTALDVTVQAEILELLRSLQADLGMGMVLVTHNFGVVADLCDRVAVMQEGEIVESGDVRQVFRDPQHPYTRQLFGAILSEEGIRPPFVAHQGVPAQEARR